MNKLVASDAARMFTKLLPSNMAPMSRSLSDVTRRALAALWSPLSACDLSLPRDAEVSAVSEPENSAEMQIRSRIAVPTVTTSKLSFANRSSTCVAKVSIAASMPDIRST